MGEYGCIGACVCLVVGVWLFVAISVCISVNSHLKVVLNEGDNHFLTQSPKWGNLICIILSISSIIPFTAILSSILQSI